MAFPTTVNDQITDSVTQAFTTGGDEALNVIVELMTEIAKGDSTRLYLCRFFPHHETDPRSSRTMVKVTGIYRPITSHHWERMSGDDLLTGIADDLGEPDGYL